MLYGYKVRRVAGHPNSNSLTHEEFGTKDDLFSERVTDIEYAAWSSSEHAIGSFVVCRFKYGLVVCKVSQRVHANDKENTYFDSAEPFEAPEIVSSVSLSQYVRNNLDRKERRERKEAENRVAVWLKSIQDDEANALTAEAEALAIKLKQIRDEDTLLWANAVRGLNTHLSDKHYIRISPYGHLEQLRNVCGYDLWCILSSSEVQMLRKSCTSFGAIWSIATSRLASRRDTLDKDIDEIDEMASVLRHKM